MTWEELATQAGATALVLLIVQFVKAPLDRIWKIPTRVLAYILAVLIMMTSAIFTGSFSISTFALIALNAVVVACGAMGAYEATFAKPDESGS